MVLINREVRFSTFEILFLENRATRKIHSFCVSMTTLWSKVKVANPRRSVRLSIRTRVCSDLLCANWMMKLFCADVN